MSKYDYADLVKGLHNEDILHSGRALLVRGWQEMPKDSLTRDLLEYVRDSMKRIVLLERPDYDSEELEGVIEPEGRSLFEGG